MFNHSSIDILLDNILHPLRSTIFRAHQKGFLGEMLDPRFLAWQKGTPNSAHI